MRVLRITAGLVVCLALCGCEEKDDVYVACWSKASGAAIGTETCMEDQGFVFITEDIFAQCLTQTWDLSVTALHGGVLRLVGGLRCK